MPIKSILIVDDSPTERYFLNELLLKHGFTVTTAENADDALTKLKASMPDLILMDVVMPTMTGLEACRALRAHDTTKATPIILVTTRGERETVEQGYASGCSDYVTKPINGLELLSKLRDQLDRGETP